jgi:hypothetical protein
MKTEEGKNDNNEKGMFGRNVRYWKIITKQIFWWRKNNNNNKMQNFESIDICICVCIMKNLFSYYLKLLALALTKFSPLNHGNITQVKKNAKMFLKFQQNLKIY